MNTKTATANANGSALSNRLQGLMTQENIITGIISLIVAAAVILPLCVLFVSSFLVLDDMGFDTEWGLENYRLLYTDRIIPKAFGNTLI
ncbi:MAG: sugar ABC transporter permease, partial [Rhodospirillales bacterium]|nr:sugar ABC transporter permease [Rhodospirillales bacterium]